jgi:uroporphyrinogen decarboxylase
LSRASVVNSGMSGLDRVFTVLAGGIPDRVPVALHNFMMCARASRIPFGEFFHDGDAMAGYQIAAWREFGHDMLMLENGTAALAEACGCEVEYPEDGAPVVTKPAIRSLENGGRLRLPDPSRDGTLPALLRATRIVRREIGDRAFVMGRSDQGPFSLASLLLGMESFLVEIALNEKPKLIHALLEFCSEASYRFAVAQVEAGSHMTSIGESIAGPGVCGPRVYVEYEWDYARRLVCRLKEKGILLSYHICGDTTSIVDRMADTGAAILELDHEVDMHRAKDVAQGRAAILGPIDPSGVLARGTPEQVDEKCREAISILGVGGGFILGAGCAIPSTTPPGNLNAMVLAAQQRGRYCLN